MGERYKKARAAYEKERDRVADLAGLTTTEPYDLTGGFVSDDSLWSLLKNPTKTEAAKIYEDLLDYASYSGWSGCSDTPFFPPEASQ